MRTWLPTAIPRVPGAMSLGNAGTVPRAWPVRPVPIRGQFPTRAYESAGSAPVAPGWTPGWVHPRSFIRRSLSPMGSSPGVPGANHDPFGRSPGSRFAGSRIRERHPVGSPFLLARLRGPGRTQEDVRAVGGRDGIAAPRGGSGWRSPGDATNRRRDPP